MFQTPSAGGSSRRRQPASDIEAEESDVPIFHDIVASLEPDLPTFPGHRVGSRRDQVIVGDDLRLDEATLDVAVDDAGGLGRLRPPVPATRGSPFRSGPPRCWRRRAPAWR